MEFTYSKDNATADALSRLPRPVSKDDFISQTESACTIDYFASFPVTAKDLTAATRRDPILGQILLWTQQGWPSDCPDPAFRPFFNRKWELSVGQGCLLWGSRVVIPKFYRRHLLDELHAMHTGASCMKSLARGHFWWPKLDQAIENMAKTCSICLETQHNPAIAPLHVWKWPEKPWNRVHIDFAELESHHYLVLIDAHSKWMEVLPMSHSTNATATIQALRTVFAVHAGYQWNWFQITDHLFSQKHLLHSSNTTAFDTSGVRLFTRSQTDKQKRRYSVSRTECEK